MKAFLPLGRVVLGPAMVGFGLGGVIALPELENPSFEIAGALPGDAEAWTASLSFAGDMIADFSESDAPSPFESFAGPSWSTGSYVWIVDLDENGTPAIFDSLAFVTPSRVESFLRWFGNAGYDAIVTGGSSAQFNGATLTAESGTASDWTTVPYVSDVSSATGNTGATHLESGESGWGSYVTEVSGGTVATFAPGGVTYESFESVQADLLVVVDAGTDRWALPGGGISGIANSTVYRIVTTGRLPAGISANSRYYVVNTSGFGTTSWQFSRSLGGSAIDVTDEGTGSHYLRGDDAVCWTNVGTL